MGAKKLTHKDLAEAVKVSVTTIKSYRKKFPEFIYMASRGKPIRFEPETLDVVKKIRACFAKDLSVEETRKILSAEFKENVENRNPSAPPSSPGVDLDVFQGLGREIEELKTLVKASGSGGKEQSSMEARLSALETGFNELISLQSRSHSLNVELLAKLDTIADSLTKKEDRPKKNQTKVVVSKPAVGKRAPGGESRTPGVGLNASAGGQDEPGLKPDYVAPVEGTKPPPADFMALPLVISNDKGEYLGINLKHGKHLDIAGLVVFLVDNAGEKRESLHWARKSPHRVLAFGQGARRHELYLKRTNTPKGNQVAVLEKLSLDGSPVSENFLIAFFKQVKSSVA